jgi:hypothetical protein
MSPSSVSPLPKTPSVSQAPKTASVSQMMSSMAMRMDSLLDSQHQDDPDIQSGNVPDEIRFWLSVDPLLAHLHKQWVDAKNARDKIAQRHGDHDVMTDIAVDMEESAQSAFETRLLEMKANEEKQAEVVSLIKAMLDAEEEMRIAKKKIQSEDFWKEFSRSRRIPKRRQDNFWMLYITMMLMQGIVQQTREDLSAACDFMFAARRPNAQSLRHSFAGCLG